MTIASLEPVKVQIPLPMARIEEFCRKRHVIEFALFGSVLRDDFRPDSDVDVLITFEPGVGVTLVDLGSISLELELMLGRRVDVLERQGVEEMRNPFLRPEILRSARVIYAR
ncbi:MAG: nucleotidyltransferase domain-containing protein [Tepidisphaeraceae bacterium]